MPKGTEFWLFLFSVAAWPTTTVTVHDRPIHRRPTYLDLITTSVLGSEGKRGLQQVPVTWYDRFGVVNVEKQIILPIWICVQCFFRIFAFFCLFFFRLRLNFVLLILFRVFSICSLSRQGSWEREKGVYAGIASTLTAPHTTC